MSNAVLITGGTSGIGLALAAAFIAHGDRVAVCGRSQLAVDSFALKYPAALAVAADVTDMQDRQRLLDAITDRFGHLDVFVSNAGRRIERDFRLGIDDDAGLDAEVRLNLTAPIQLTAAILARWPTLATLVFISSGNALVSPTRAPNYGAAKAGLHGFVEGLRRQLAGRAHVVEVLPPSVDTPATAKSTAKKISPETVAMNVLAALEDRRDLVLPGKTRFLPIMLRIAPGTISRLVSAI